MKTKVHRILFPLFLASVLLPAQRGLAAFDAFLKITGVEGESTDAQHFKEIDILSFSWGMSVPPAAPGGTSRAVFQDLALTKLLDKSSPILALKCASGEHIQEVILTLRSKGNVPNEFYKIRLTDVLISGVQVGGSTGETRPSESFTLNYATIEWEYRPQNPDGSLGSPIKAGWNLKTNTKI